MLRFQTNKPDDDDLFLRHGVHKVFAHIHSPTDPPEYRMFLVPKVFGGRSTRRLQTTEETV